jgi:hypothetical protein
MHRPTPFDLIFTEIADERFPRIRASLEASAHDPADRDAFLMEREAVVLLRELRPDEGLGEGIDQLAALLHHAYLFWDAGTTVVAISDEQLAELLADQMPDGSQSTERVRPFYAQLPERRMWAMILEGEPPEPLDGCFVYDVAGELRVLGVFGVRSERMGFSVVEAIGPRQLALVRPDGSRLFAPTLAGGTAAGLHSLVGAEELLELGWRARTLAEESLTGAGRWMR